MEDRYGLDDQNLTAFYQKVAYAKWEECVLSVDARLGRIS